MQRPIVLVSNAPSLPPALAGGLRHLPFRRPAPSTAVRLLAGVCAAEHAHAEHATLHMLVQHCRCDLRCVTEKTS